MIFRETVSFNRLTGCHNVGLAVLKYCPLSRASSLSDRDMGVESKNFNPGKQWMT